MNNFKNQNIPIKAILLHEFKNSDLIEHACTHPSYRKSREFQRLEFLGDRLLGLHVAHKIYHIYENSNEGQLSVLFSHLVSAAVITQITTPHILSYIKYTGALNNSIVADTFEAILAAVFLDGGDVKNIVETLWTPYINKNKNMDFTNPKNILQEITHNDCQYKVKENTDEMKLKFTAKASTKGTIATGEGKSKKEASENAAQNLIRKLQTKDNR